MLLVQAGLYRDHHTKAVGSFWGRGAVHNRISLGFLPARLGWLSFLLKVLVRMSSCKEFGFASALSSSFYFFLARNTQNISLKMPHSATYSPVSTRACVCKQTPSTKSPLTQTWGLRGSFSDQTPALGEALRSLMSKEE